MLKFYETEEAGKRAEVAVANVLQRYTRHVYKNIRVETLFTKSGTTEVDILAAIADVILVLEIKNIASIEGSSKDLFWYLTGMEGKERYSSLNILTQNRLHTRAIKNAWRDEFREMPAVVSAVVIPEDCHISEEIIDSGILTLHEFELQVAELAQASINIKYGYKLDYLVEKGCGCIKRSVVKGG